MYVPELMPRDPPEPGGPCRRLDDPLQQPGRVARAFPGRGEEPGPLARPRASRGDDGPAGHRRRVRVALSTWWGQRPSLSRSRLSALVQEAQVTAFQTW